MTFIVGAMLLLVPASAGAKSIANLDVQIASPEEIHEKCDTEKSVKTFGCFWPETDVIYVRSDLTPFLFSFTLTHEIGHFFFEGSDFLEHFGYQKKNAYEAEEYLATQFAFWIIDPTLVTPKERAYFTSLVVGTAD